MTPPTVWRVALLLLAILVTVDGAVTCSHKLAACTKTVRPFLNNLRYMFPLTLTDVDDMCRMWSDFVDCVRQYMVLCTSERQRAKFNNAVADSVKTVHSICSTDKHQREYLANAFCFKRVSIGSCGVYYQRMVTQVTNAQADRTNICCAYGQFKSCVSAPLLRNCGAKAHALMDHSMAYLVTLCRNTFYPRSFSCPTAAPPGRTSLSPPTMTDRQRAVMMTTTSVPPPRTIIYPLPSTQRSRTAGCDSLEWNSFFTTVATCFVSTSYVIFFKVN